MQPPAPHLVRLLCKAPGQRAHCILHEERGATQLPQRRVLPVAEAGHVPWQGVGTCLDVLIVLQGEWQGQAC